MNTYYMRMLLCHMSMRDVRVILGYKPAKPGEDPRCPSCDMAKMAQKSLPKTASRPRATRMALRLHMDVFFTKELTFHAIVDDFSRKSWVKKLKSKSENHQHFVDLRKHLENVYAPYKVAFRKSDAEGIYNSNA
jgi:hypothetical protein